MRPGLYETDQFDPWQGFEGKLGAPQPGRSFVAAPWLSQGRLPPPGLVGPPGMQGAVGHGAIGDGFDPAAMHGVVNVGLSFDELMRRAALHSNRVFTPPRRF